MSNLTESHSTAAAPARRASRGRLLTTVAVATLAALAFFTVFYVIGAVVGLAVIGALGVAALIGLAWVSLKLGRRSARRPQRVSNTAPETLP